MIQTKLFSDLYLAKFLDFLAKPFFLYRMCEKNFFNSEAFTFWSSNI